MEEIIIDKEELLGFFSEIGVGIHDYVQTTGEGAGKNRTLILNGYSQDEGDEYSIEYRYHE
jgi:hypothetical protein